MKVESTVSLHELVEAGVVQLTRGKVISKKDIAACPGHFPIYSSAKDNDGKFGEYGKFLFDEELITWSVDGGGRLFHRPKHKFSVTNVGGILRLLDKTSLDYRYLYYVLSLRHSEIRFDWVRKAHPSVIQKLYKQIPIPVLSEQKRIVAILDEVFEGIATAGANAERNLQNAQAIFESYLKFVFGRRGKGWTEKRLDEVCTFSSGGTPSKQNASYWTGKIPWISGRDMKSTRLSDSYLHISKAAVEESATRMAPSGALLILVRGMGLAHGAQIGELMVPSAFNQDIRGIHPIPELLPRYLLFALRDGVNSSDTVLSNAAHGTLKIDSYELQKVIIPFPAREQQQRIVVSIDSLAEGTERLTSIYERKLAALDALKKSLLHHAFAGELTANKTSELIEAVA
jgi:type I restriction enzyme S subunit